ncbi:MAG: solute:sodium symporter family transporter, partial [Rhodopirellula bahusiensis]
YFIPLASVILLGLFHKTADGRSAMVALLVGLVLMVIGTFFGGGDGGWLASVFGNGFHYMGAVFVLLVALQLIMVAMGIRRDSPYEQRDAKLVDLTPWKPAPYVGGVLVLLCLSVYAFFAI